MDPTFCSIHGYFFFFRRMLKDEQKKVEVTIAQADRGGRLPNRRKKWRDFEDRLVALKRQLRDREISGNDYFEAIRMAATQFV